MLGLAVILFYSLVTLSSGTSLTWVATPYNPPSIPLAVRSPYLSAWLPQGPGAALNDVWASFWNGQPIGWAGFVKVDGKAYSFLGAPVVPNSDFQKAKQKSFTLTTTQSIFVLSAGPVDITVNFLSPVEPNDLVKHSTPFSYMAVSAASTDEGEHDIQVYSDISADWVTGDNSTVVTWSSYAGDAITHQIQLMDPTTFAEVNDQAKYGAAYYSILNDARATAQTGSDITVRAEFIKNGRLPNTPDTAFRAPNNACPVFALSQDLGKIKSTSSPIIFSVGHVRDPAVQYITAGNVMQTRSHYWRSKYNSPDDLISFFLKDYSNALSSASSFDLKVETDAKKISDDYKDIVILSIRQAFAALEVTISKNADNTYNSDDVLLFMKEISSNGNANTVDVMFPTWPLFLYTNPKLGKYLLEGSYRYQASGQYPNKWAVHDLGTNYPNATGHNDGYDEQMPLEESANMIIMTLSYARATGDHEHIEKYHILLAQWCEYLISDSLVPALQLSTDDFAGHLANQTNLAIKGIIGIRAMGEIEALLGNHDRAESYIAIATDYVTKWQTLAASSSGKHLTLSYGQDESWGLAYNLFPDKLFKFNLFPQSVYDTQTAWYKTVQQAYGVPLDTRHAYTKSDWEIWTAAVMSDQEGRDLFIGLIRKWIASGATSIPFSDWYETSPEWYETSNGQQLQFRARAVAGGHLALTLKMKQDRHHVLTSIA